MDNCLMVLKKMVDNMIEEEYDNQLLKSIMLDIIGGLAYLDLEGNYVLANDYYCESFGCTKEEMIGSKYSKFVFPSDMPKLQESYWEMMENGRSSVIFKGVRKDGVPFTKEVTMVKRHNSRGEFIGCYSFMRVL